MLFKKLFTLKIEKYEFFKISISHIFLKKDHEKCHIFSGNTLHAIYFNWLIKENKEQRKISHVVYFVKLKSIL